MNARWIRGSKAVNPALEEPKFGVVKTTNLMVLLMRKKIMN